MGEIRLVTVNDYFHNPVGADKSALAIILKRPVEYLDENNYKVKLTAGAIHPQKGYLAWVDFYIKEISPNDFDCNYYLRIQMDESLVLEWTIETYNPFFGCRVNYIAWHDDSIVIIYSEKHRSYAASLALHREMIRKELGRKSTNLYVRGEALFTFFGNTLKGYKLPTLDEMESLTIPQGIEMGILEEII